MTIQISVLLWTAINFCVLMLLLTKLLFKPMLSFMDARREKIEAAKRARESAEQERAAALAQAGRDRDDAAARALEGAQAAYDDAKREAALTVTTQERKYERLYAECDEQTEAAKRQLGTELDTRLSDIAEAFARKLTS